MNESDDVGITVNATPVRVKAKLLISHDDLEPTEITSLLSLQPTNSHKKGEIKPPNKVPKKTGFWSLTVESAVRSNDISPAIDLLLDQIANRHSLLRELRDRGYRVQINCRFGIKHWNTMCELKPETMRRLANLSLPLGLDVYDEQEQ